MRKSHILTLVLLVLCTTVCYGVPEESSRPKVEMSEGMQKYMEACLRMLEGIDNGFDKFILGESIDLYNRVKLSPFNQPDWMPRNNREQVDELLPGLLFTPEYADRLITEQKLIEVDDPTLLRGDPMAEIFLLHKGINPGGKIEYTSSGEQECEMLVIGETGSDLLLTISVDGTEFQGVPVQGSNTSYVKWTLPAHNTLFDFSITNNADKPSSFVIAIY